MIATQYAPERLIPRGTQIQFASLPRLGDEAQVLVETRTSRNAETWAVVKLTPQYQDTPAYKGTDKISWEWECTEPSFWLSYGERVWVFAFKRLIIPAPPNYGPEPWIRDMAFIQRVGREGFAWCTFNCLEVPWLMNL